MNNFILDFLFPKKCLGCGREGTWFCQDCLSKISYLDNSFVRLTNSHLEGYIAVAYFKNPLKEAIHAFKYDGVRELGGLFSGLIVQHLKDGRLEFISSSNKPILIPVPLHKSKEIERGFNQSKLLAEEIGKKLNLKTKKNLLIKTKKTLAQIELKEAERRGNVKGAFAFVGNKKEISRKTVWLIDDVMTTSSTLAECAKVLKKAGAKKVWGLVLAKD